ncbi:MAG: nicotinate (nicotinamide) nucleotide adenylyltransferase [Reichenbachiella sp.]
MKVGLFFGSFNPIHVGHMIIAQTMIESGELDELWFIISPQNPMKKNKNLLHEFDRLDMVEASIVDNPKMKAIDIEFGMSKPSYTVKTLAVISEKYPDHQFKLIIGEDNLSNFHKWKNHEEILKHHKLLVYPRPNSKEHKLVVNTNIEMVDAPMIDISATFIRSKIKKGHSIKYLVPPEVGFYIESKKLYQ